MKKTSNSKKGTMPGGAPKGINPLAYFNSLKGKPKTEPKQTLKKAQNGIQTNGYGEDPNKYVMNKTNIFGNTKFKEISKKKFDRVSNRYSNQKGSESLGTNESIGQQVISGRNKKNYVSRVDEVREAELEDRYPDYKTEEQELILDPMRQLKKGGSVKSKKK
jgi:hypothetical protein